MDGIGLLDKTLNMLRDRPASLTYLQIEIDTGIPAHWLSNFSRGVFPDPHIKRIETLYAYLLNAFSKTPYA